MDLYGQYFPSTNTEIKLVAFFTRENGMNISISLLKPSPRYFSTDMVRACTGKSCKLLMLYSPLV